MSRSERERLVGSEPGFVRVRYPNVDIAVSDAEFFIAACSDIVVFETDDLHQYAA